MSRQPGAPERTGGAHSTVADLTDMRVTAGVLETEGNAVRRAGGDLVSALLDLPAAAVPFAPLHAAGIAADELRLVHHPNGILATGVDLELTARALRGAAVAYAVRDACVAASLRSFKVIIAAPRVALTLYGTVQVSLAASVPLPRKWDWARDAAMPPCARNINPLAGVVGCTTAALIANPELTDATLLTAQQLLFVVDPMTAPTLEAQAAAVVRYARAGRLLKDDRPLTVTPVAPHERTHLAPPRDGAQVISSIDRLETTCASAGNTASRIRVRQVTTADGVSAWIVEVPGTQDWSADRPRNPSDAAANLLAVAGMPSSLYPAIEKALRTSMAKKGVTPGSQPVLIAGHSQGGIVATRLAQDRRFRQTFQVTHVITAGSPVSRIALPANVKSLDFAHRADPVPRLDTQGPPDRMNRYGLTGDPARRVGDETDPIAVHGATRYADSAAHWAPANSTDPNVRDFYDSPFFHGITGTVDDYHLQRPGPPDVVATPSYTPANR